MSNNGYSIKYFDLAAYDLIINLPVLKLHTTVGFTGAVKNFYGILEPQSKVFLHKYKIVGNALKVLCSYLSSLNIYTFLDARIVPDAQQLLWGNSKSLKFSLILFFYYSFNM
ncbi:DUF362 domain-containing protein [Paramaledivibacter caminithermalis]|uniref:DUF362 domain-containing protein n=1 Tax=Paramaledivibacter caminithermalis TaxID=191027 RepID=UPI0013F4CD93|nr:DUF362 domain-containing protein [Paramaledivibacter caminithermalis]